MWDKWDELHPRCAIHLFFPFHILVFTPREFLMESERTFSLSSLFTPHGRVTNKPSEKTYGLKLWQMALRQVFTQVTQVHVNGSHYSILTSMYLYSPIVIRVWLICVLRAHIKSFIFWNIFFKIEKIVIKAHISKILVIKVSYFHIYIYIYYSNRLLCISC